MSAFEIVETLMCPRITKGHPTSSLLAQESGCSLLLVDLANDKKIKMHRHETEIDDIILTEDYLISVDCGPKASVLITSMNSLKRIGQFYMPASKRRKNKPTHSTRLAFSSKFSRLIIVESELEGGYRISGWDLKRHNDIKLFFIADIDTPDRCLSVQVMETRNNDLLVVTCESRVVKYWKMSEKSSQLTNRIHVKEDLVTILVEQTNNVVLALTKSGKIILLNDSGDYLTTIKGERSFTSMANHLNFCFFGTSDGSVAVYDMKTVTRLSEVAYSSDAKQPFLIGEANYSDDENEDGEDQSQAELSHSVQPPQGQKLKGSAYLKIMGKGPAVVGLTLFHEGSLLGITHADGLFVVQNLSENSVSYSSFCHFQRVNSIHWHEEKTSCFFSVGNEGYFAVWQLFHDRWIPRVYDIHKSIDEDVKVSSKSAKKNGFISITGATQGVSNKADGKAGKSSRLKITCISVNYVYREIYLGDNKGSITVLHLDNYGIKGKYKVCNFKIKRISMTPQNGYLAIVLSTGMSLLLSILNSFQIALKIEDHIIAHTTPQTSILFKQIFCFTDSVTKNEEIGMMPTKLKLAGLSQNDYDLSDAGGNRRRDLQPLMQDSLNRLQASNYYSELNGQGTNNPIKQPTISRMTKKSSNPNSFLAIAAHSSNSMRLHSVNINVLDDSVTGLVMMVFQTEGRISACDLHPSKDYILILDEVGLCYLYRIRSGELRGRIEVPLYCSNLSIDPSGLYFMLSAHSDLTEEFQNKHLQGNQEDDDEEDEDVEFGENKAQVVKVLSMREVSGSAPSPFTITKEIVRDMQSYDKNQQFDPTSPASSFKSISSPSDAGNSKQRKYLADIETFFNSSKKAIRPKQVLLFELGTGKQVGEIQSLFETSSLGFSSNSEYMYACSQKGTISIWSPVEEISENINQMFRYLENEPNFWQQFPIFIKKNLIDVRQLKQNLKNIVNLDHLNEVRQKEYKKIPSSLLKPSKQTYLKNSQKRTPPINDIQLIKFQQAHDDQLSHLSPIQQRTADQRRITNFERAYSNIENNTIQRMTQPTQIMKLQPAHQRAQGQDYPIKLQADHGKRYHMKQHIENPPGEKKNLETPIDIDDDVGPVNFMSSDISRINSSQNNHSRNFQLKPTQNPFSITHSRLVQNM